jgi:hypothetical protein
MNRRIKIVAAIIIAISPKITLSKPNSEIALKWGLENKKYFQEIKAPENASSSMQTKARPNENQYRFFRINDYYNKKIMSVFERFNPIWSEYSERNQSDTPLVKKKFSDYLHKKDLLLSTTIHEMAPTLFFDFTGKSNTQYILDEIEIQTIRFDEYKGGGFSENEAWYDIELKHQVGTYKYKIDEGRLRFTGSGRTVLRFWSDNYISSMGMSPMGCFDINITFHYIANGKRISVSTGRFKIDV